MAHPGLLFAEGTPTEVWKVAFGPDAPGAFTQGFAVAVDSQSNVYQAAATVASFTCGAPVINKYDSGGGLVWSRPFLDGGCGLAFKVAVDTHGFVYAAGYSGEDLQNAPAAAVVGKWDAEGRLQWRQRYEQGLPRQMATGLALDGEHGFVHTLIMQHRVTGFARPIFSRLLRYNTSGQLLLETPIAPGEAFQERPVGLAADPARIITLTSPNSGAYRAIRFNLDTSVAWAKRGAAGFSEGVDVSLSPSGRVAIAVGAFQAPFEPENAQIFRIESLSSDGSLERVITEGSPFTAAPIEGVIATSFDRDERLYGAGISQRGASTFPRMFDFAARKYDEAGARLWELKSRLGESAILQDIAVANSGDIYLTGNVFFGATGSFRAMLVKFRQGGSTLSLEAVGPTERSGTVTKALAEPWKVRVLEGGAPKAGVTVRWAITDSPGGAQGQDVVVAPGFPGTVVASLDVPTNGDGESAVNIELGNLVGSYAVTANCADCVPTAVVFVATAELHLALNLSEEAIEPYSGDGAPTAANKTTVSVLAYGAGGIADTVADYPLALASEPVALSGGHDHDGGRPKGHFELVGQPSLEGPSMFIGTTTADGSLQIVFVSSSIGGQENLTAGSNIDEGVLPATGTVTVEVPGLADAALIAASTQYAFSGQTSSHTANHFALVFVIAGTTTAAVAYFTQTGGQVIGINDMSLQKGGLFDVRGGWKPPHLSHRLGRSIDVNRCGSTPNGLALINQALLDEVLETNGGDRVVETALGPPPCPGPANTPRIHYDF